MSRLVFKPDLQKRRSYSVQPDDQNLRRGLDIIFAWGHLNEVMKFALERRGWHSEFGYCGVEYPTRPQREGQVRYCFKANWWAKRYRKCHAPEAEYVGLLAAIARLNGWDKWVRDLEAFVPVTPVNLRLTPDIYDIENYHGITGQNSFCLAMILGLFNFEKAREYAQERKGFYIKPVHEGIHYSAHQVQYLPEKRMRLRIGQQELTVRESKYLDVLDAVLKVHGLEPIGGQCV